MLTSTNLPTPSRSQNLPDRLIGSPHVVAKQMQIETQFLHLHHREKVILIAMEVKNKSEFIPS
jgi:hypothetical protein